MEFDSKRKRERETEIEREREGGGGGEERERFSRFAHAIIIFIQSIPNYLHC